MSGPSPTTYFDSTYESGDVSEWSTFSVGGFVANALASGTGTYHALASLTDNTINNFALHTDVGTAGNLATQITGEFLVQFKVSFDNSLVNTIIGAEQKLFICQWYDSTVAGGSFSNLRRKYQLIVSVGGTTAPAFGVANGTIWVNLLEWDNEDGVTGPLIQTAALPQNSTTNKLKSYHWDELRLRVVPNTTSSGGLGAGTGNNGVVQLWHNNTLIISYSNVNLIEASATSGIGRFIQTTALGNALWFGGTSGAHFDDVYITNSETLLPAMITAPVPRVLGNSLMTTMSMNTLPSQSNEHGSIVTGGSFDGSNCYRITLPVPDDPPVNGLEGVQFTDSNVAWIGFAVKFGADYCLPFFGVGGTQKPFIVHRANGLSAQRLILQNRTAGSVIWWYFNNGVETLFENMTAASQTVPSSNVNTGTDSININGHYRITGDRITYAGSTGTVIGGLTAGREYYAIAPHAWVEGSVALQAVDNNNLKLANTYAEALAGTAINLTSQGTGNHTFTRQDSFAVNGNLNKWFWFEFECNNTDNVLRMYATAIDGVYNRVIPTGYNTWQESGGVPVWESAPCVRRLITQTPLLYSGSPFSYFDLGYFEGYDEADVTSNTILDIDEIKASDHASRVSAATGFP